MTAADVLICPQHEVALVPSGPGSLAWLEATLRRLEGELHPRRITLVAPSPYIAAVLSRHLDQFGWSNVSTVVQLRPVAEWVARASGSRAFDHPLNGPLESAAIRVAVRESGGPALRRMAANRSLQDALLALFRDLGHLDNVDSVLASMSQSGATAAAATRAYAAYVALIRRFPDVPRQLQIAASLTGRDDATDPTWSREIGPVVTYLLPPLDSSEEKFLVAVGRHVPVAAAFTWVDDQLADNPTREAAEKLARDLGVRLSTTDDHAPRPAVHILSAPDPEEEARSVVRQVLADMEGGVPLWRTALLYTADERYAQLVRETLDSAGLPWHSALGRPAAAGLAARSFLALLALRERGFAREAVLDWLVARPAHSGVTDDPVPDVPISAWDRLSRRAQVRQGAEQWIARFERLIQTLEYEEQQRQDWHAEARGHDDIDETPRSGRDVEYAHAIVAAIRQLDRDTRPPAEPAPWDAFVDWASHLLQTYVREDPAWPESELLASEALQAALQSLRDASQLEPTTTIGEFRDALSAALEGRRLEEGRAGEGVVVGPVGSSMGASFDRVWILGMAEGSIPAPRQASADPLTSGGAQTDPLGRDERLRSSERRAFLSALSGIYSNGAVHLSYSRSDGGARASHPSRWLLEQIARLEGVPTIYASDMPKLFGDGRAWLERIASAYDGLRRSTTPLNAAERRLTAVIASHAAGRDPSRSPLASRADLILGRALRASRARRSPEFTDFDGNLGKIAAESKRVAAPFANGSSASSATSLERWAGCPFHYFMVNVLRVEATERPEEEWTINALDKGTLVHAVLEQFFRERFEQGRSTADEPFTDADHLRLDEIASMLLSDLEAQGRTGHSVVWENARALLLRDLHMQLEREEAWRLEEGLAPVLFERTFGNMRDPETWRAVELPLADGTTVRFRGAIDRVDVSPESGTRVRARVIDYKSGGTWGFDGLDVDPVAAGRKVQLALYARAVRENVVGHDAEVHAEYRFVSSKGKFERREILVDERVDERLQQVVQHTANGIRAGIFLPMPGEPDRGSFKNCRFCDYDRICSTTRDEAWRIKSPNASFVPLEKLQ